jgi:UDP-4-amino-4,6-dideoxy-N-acetyl-beta-L-altrosamine N-acetyltransferase
LSVLKILSLSIRPAQQRDLLELLIWRNHPNIRRFMLTQHEISLDEHKAWFDRTVLDQDRSILIIEDGDRPIGYVQFRGITGEYVDWGFYVDPCSPKGSGRKLAMIALTHAFDYMGLTRIRGKALPFNQASIKLHLSCGFLQEQNREKIKLEDGRIEDLICFILERSAWEKMGLKNA